MKRNSSLIVVNSSSSTRTVYDHSDMLFDDLDDDEFLIIIFFSDIYNLGAQETLKEFKNSYSKFIDFGCKLIGVSTDDQVELNKFSTSKSIKYQLKNTSQIPAIAEMGELGIAFGDGVIPSKYKSQIVITNNNKEILIRFRKIIPIKHANLVLNWIIDNVDTEPMKPGTEAKELS